MVGQPRKLRTHSVCIRVNCDKPGKVPESSEALHRGALITHRGKLEALFTYREERILIYLHKGALITYREKLGALFTYRKELFTSRSVIHN
jgi:hypothetical protein